MRVGVNLPTSGPLASAAAVRAVAEGCEALGYDSVWTADHITWTAANAAHHFPVGAIDAWRAGTPPHHFDPIATLAFLAGCTTTIRLGTAVLILPVRNPVILAKELASLDELSGGRLALGVGVGGTAFADAELGAVGAGHLRPRRGRVMDEWIDVMRAVWTQSTCTFAGEFIEISDATVFPKPRQAGGPPVLVGGDSPTALARVARRADGSIVSRLRPDQVAERRERLAGLAAPYGRAEVHFHLVALRWLAIDADDAVARARAEATLGQMQRGGRPISRDVRYVGEPGRLQELLAADRSAGIDEVILQVVAGSESEVLDGLARFRDEVVAPLAAGSSV